MDLKALSLKDELDNDEIDKLTDYFIPLTYSSTNRNTINKDKFIFYFKKLLTSRGIEIQNNVLTKEKVFAKRTKYLGLDSMGYKFTLSYI